MRLLYVHTEPLSSRKANVVQVKAMCTALAEEGAEVVLAAPLPDRADSLASSPAAFDVVSYSKVMVAGRLATLGAYFGARGAIRQVRPDVCFVRVPALLRAAIATGTPAVLELHNSKLHTRSRLLDALWRRQLLKWARTDKIRLVITISEALREYWADQGIPRSKLVALHDGFSRAAFQSAVSRQEARRQLNLDEPRKIVAYAGSLFPDRGIESIFELAKRFAGVHFVIVGGPESRRQGYLAEAERLGNVEFVGWVPAERVPLYLFAADVLLMIWSRRVPTINYCSPLKMFEYMASGRVIVGHGFPTIREVLTDGDNALLADPDDFEELADKLRAALGLSEAPDMAARARRLAFESYGWDVRARRILQELSARAPAGEARP